MDPTETLRLLQDAYLTARKNLADWLNMGGFPPKNHTRESVRKHMIPMVNAARKHVMGDEG